MLDLLIRRARIVDGTGGTWFYGDIGVLDTRIVDVGDLRGVEAVETISAAGMVACPGFIDMHTHSDLFILEQSVIPAKVRQGITTDLLGQDGIAASPLSSEYVAAWRKNLAGLDGTPDITWDWTNVESYLQKIESNHPSYNLAYLVPHGNLRMVVLGLDDREAHSAEIRQMQDVLRESLDQGALGMSTGLIYPPCCFSTLAELEALCQVLAEYDAPLVIHQRSEGDEILESMRELIGIMRRTGARLHFSHLKVCGRDNWHKTEAVLGLIDQAREEGIDVTFDQYPYTAGSTMLSAILPPWMHAGGSERMLERLASKELRDRAKHEMATALPGWDSMSKWAGWDGIYVTSVASAANQRLVGKHMSSIAMDLGISDPADAAFQLILDEKNAVGMIDFVMDEESVARIMSHPAGTIGSDGLLGGEPHPRAYGTFPRVLGRFVRDRGVLRLEEMVRRMTSQPARILGLHDRGLIKPGMKADLVVFDADKVGDTATFEQPRQYPVGISYVVANGHVIVDHENIRQCHAGEVLRRVSRRG